MRIFFYILNSLLAGSLLAALAVIGLQWLEAREDNRSLRLQMKMMAEQSAEVTKIQQDTFSQLYQLDRNTSRIVHGTIKHAKLNEQMQAVHGEALDNSGASMFQPNMNLDQRTAARRGFDVLETNNAVLLEKLRIMNSRLMGRYELLSALPSIRPVDGWISSGYGYRNSPTTGKRDWHNGMDIAARKGSTVSASGDGIVIKAGNHGSYGTLVEIDHGQGIRTRYAHNGKLFVQRGDRVQRGQKIALVGMTGRTTGAHLHYEVIVGNKSVNPARFLNLNEFSPPIDGVDVEAAALAAASVDASVEGSTASPAAVKPMGGGDEVDAYRASSIPALNDLTLAASPAALDFSAGNRPYAQQRAVPPTNVRATSSVGPFSWQSWLYQHRLAMIAAGFGLLLLAGFWLGRRLQLGATLKSLYELPFQLLDRPFAIAAATRVRRSHAPVSYWQRPAKVAAAIVNSVAPVAAPEAAANNPQRLSKRQRKKQRRAA